MFGCPFARSSDGTRTRLSWQSQSSTWTASTSRRHSFWARIRGLCQSTRICSCWTSSRWSKRHARRRPRLYACINQVFPPAEREEQFLFGVQVALQQLLPTYSVIWTPHKDQCSCVQRWDPAPLQLLQASMAEFTWTGRPHPEPDPGHQHRARGGAGGAGAAKADIGSR